MTEIKIPEAVKKKIEEDILACYKQYSCDGWNGHYKNGYAAALDDLIKILDGYSLYGQTDGKGVGGR